MLGLLGFYDEFDNRSGRPNGSIHAAVRPVGEPDEADLVAYLDAGHVLIDVMEAGHDVITGDAHRNSAGCSSLVTDGAWLWRQDFSHEGPHTCVAGPSVAGPATCRCVRWWSGGSVAQCRQGGRGQLPWRVVGFDEDDGAGGRMGEGGGEAAFRELGERAVG